MYKILTDKVDEFKTAPSEIILKSPYAWCWRDVEYMDAGTGTRAGAEPRPRLTYISIGFVRGTLPETISPFIALPGEVLRL